ncbi:hypothetical protein XELAEV_18041578mg [Xenopus laevis]|uniref:CCHC-type domain-containing protein n=1 Tax=Xenopus laevis TaxID=8355 RepID=A0A974C2E2_XENLA|nr:hypothetical protein XELAEV_18041578mg [Xenopus laevis]
MRKKSAFPAKCMVAEAKEPRVGTAKHAVKSRVRSGVRRKVCRGKVKALSAAGKKESAKHENSTVPGGEAGGPTQTIDSVTALPVSAESTSAITAGESGLVTGEGTSSSAICLASVSAMEAASLSIGEALDGSCHGVQPAVVPAADQTNMAAGKAGGPAELEEDCKLLAESIAEETLRGNEGAVPADKSARDFAKLTIDSAPPPKAAQGESVLVSDTIIKAIKAMESLQKRKVELNGKLMRQIESTGLAKGESRAQSIRTMVQLKKELEDLEQDIAGTMDIIKPWEDFYQNKGHFGTMSGGTQVTSQTVKQMILDFNPELTEHPKSRTDSGFEPHVVSTDTAESMSVSCVVSGSGGGARVGGAGGKDEIGGNEAQSECRLVGELWGGNPVTQSNIEGQQAAHSVWGRIKPFTNQGQQSGTLEGQVFKRWNVVRIRWDGEKEKFPGTRFSCRNLIKQSMGFTPDDIYAFVTACDVEYDDITVWLRRSSSGYRAQVRLEVQNNVPKHLPNSLFIGKERASCFYPGQPRQCFIWPVTGCISKKCSKIQCNLCGTLGHTHRECPDAWHKITKACPRVEEELFQPIEEPVREQGREEEPMESGNDAESEEVREGDSEEEEAGQKGSRKSPPRECIPKSREVGRRVEGGRKGWEGPF